MSERMLSSAVPTDEHPAAGYPAAAPSKDPVCMVCGSEEEEGRDSTSEFEMVDYPVEDLEDEEGSPDEKACSEEQLSDTEYQAVEFIFQSGSEIQKVDVIKVDIELKLIEIRKMLNIEDGSCFLKNGKKLPKDKEAKTALDKVAEEDDDDTKPMKVIIECPPLYSTVSRHATFITDTNGLKEYLYQNNEFTQEQRAQAKVLIVLGGTGAGKTTLLNTLVTYALGVRRHDDFRYRIVDDTGKDQTKSVTSEVTEYYIEETTRTPPMLIIDTPGFGDCGGYEVDRKTFEQIKETFHNSIDRIHAVCFVGKAPDERLTEFQEYILQNIVKLFGQDIAKNFVTMATFCDGGRVLIKKALEASEFFQPIIRAGPHVLYEFNNSAVFNDPKTSGDLHQQFWNMGMTSMEHFVNEFLKKVEPSGLIVTRENLKQRKQIEDHMYSLQKNSELLHLQKYALEKEKSTIEAMQHRINQGKSFEYWAERFESEKTECEPGKMVTHCLICSHTCHDDCPFPNGEKYRCWVFHRSTRFSLSRFGKRCEGDAGGCCVCPKGCSYKDHCNSGYIIRTVKKQVKMTDSNLKKMYVDATSKKSASQQILEAKEKEIKVLSLKDLTIHMEIQHSMKILQQVALKKDTYTATAKYYRTLIEMEEAKPQDVSTQRKIQDLKRNAEYEEQLAEHCSKDSIGGLEEINEQIQEIKKGLVELEKKTVVQANQFIAKLKTDHDKTFVKWIVDKIFG